MDTYGNNGNYIPISSASISRKKVPAAKRLLHLQHGLRQRPQQETKGEPHGTEEHQTWGRTHQCVDELPWGTKNMGIEKGSNQENLLETSVGRDGIWQEIMRIVAAVATTRTFEK